MSSEYHARKRARRRAKVFVTVYWLVLLAAIAFGIEWLVNGSLPSDETAAIAIVGALIAAVLVHWGVLQSLGLRE